MVRFVSLAEAANLIPDGITLAVGGMTLYRRPAAFAHALVQRSPRPKSLALLAFTAGYESDVLVGAGCVETVRSVYFGLESFGLAPMFTELANQGEITVCEETESSIVMGLRATMAGVGFMPSHAWIGTDLLPLRPDVRTIDDPYSGETLVAFPAITVDIAVLHGLEADRNGNVRLNNNLGIDMELAYCADTVIVTVERIVDQLERSLDGPILPAPGADYIVAAPNGAWPTSCYPAYALDGESILRYVDACNEGRFDAYLAALEV